MQVLFYRDLPLHALLLALVLAQVFLLREISESETRLTQVILRNWFTPAGIDSQNALYNTSAVITAINATLTTYYTKIDLSLHDIDYPLDANGQILPVVLQMYGHFSNRALYKPFALYNITYPQKMMGPFNLSDVAGVQMIFKNATKMKTTLKVVDVDHPSFLYIVETIYQVDVDVVFVRAHL